MPNAWQCYCKWPSVFLYFVAETRSFVQKRKKTWGGKILTFYRNWCNLCSWNIMFVMSSGQLNLLETNSQIICHVNFIAFNLLETHILLASRSTLLFVWKDANIQNFKFSCSDSWHSFDRISWGMVLCLYAAAIVHTHYSFM
jgi:hypothetical protein